MILPRLRPREGDRTADERSLQDENTRTWSRMSRKTPCAMLRAALGEQKVIYYDLDEEGGALDVVAVEDVEKLSTWCRLSYG